MKKAKPALTPAFRDLAVKPGKAGERVDEGPHEWGLVEQTLRHGAKGTPNGVGNRRMTPEERKLPRLQAEGGRLKRALEIVMKAAASFTKDTL